MSFTLASGFEEAVGKLPEIDTASKDAADEILAVAQEIGPVVSGAYVAGMFVQKTTSGYRVLASDPKSAWVEFGVPSDNEPAQFILRRATETAGYSFTKRSA